MTRGLQLFAWLVCVAYSSVPGYWFLVHPLASHWRSRKRSPYFVLLPAWLLIWMAVKLITAPWRAVRLYPSGWSWLAAVPLFAAGAWLYLRSVKGFSASQLGGVPEIVDRHREQGLVTIGIRARVRHPIYLAHLCEMVAWTVGSGLAVCYGLTAFTLLTGAIMIRMEDAELEARFGEEYRRYRARVPAILPSLTARSRGES